MFSANSSPNQGASPLLNKPRDLSPHQVVSQLFSKLGNLSPNQGGGGLPAKPENLSPSPGRGGLFSNSGVLRGQEPYGFVNCSIHRNRHLELFCKTDKAKICVNCAYSEDHKGHDIDLIENMRPNMLEKGLLYEKSLKDLLDSKNLTSSIINEAAKPFAQILKERQRNEEMTRIKAWFLIQHYIDSQNANFDQLIQKKSLSGKELRDTAQNYKSASESGLVKTMAETLEEIKVKFDQSVFEALSAEAKVAIQEQSEKLKNELNEIYNQESGDVVKSKSHFLIKKTQNRLELETRSERESFELKLDELKDVTSLSIIYEKLYFHEEDLNLLKLVLLNLASLETLSLHFQDNAAPRFNFTINGWSIFIHLLQSFQLAKHLRLNKLRNFVFISESSDVEAHNQLNQMILKLTDEMNSLKLLKVHLKHTYQDPIHKEWQVLKDLRKTREAKEKDDLKELRELIKGKRMKEVKEWIKERSEDDLKNQISQKEQEVFKKAKTNLEIKILNILVQNPELENVQFILPNVEIYEPELPLLRQIQARDFRHQRLLLIRAKNFDSSAHDERSEPAGSGLFANSGGR